MATPGHSDNRALHLICARAVPFIDSETLCDRTGREALFRKEGCFILYMSDGELTSLKQEATGQFDNPRSFDLAQRTGGRRRDFLGLMSSDRRPPTVLTPLNGISVLP